MSFFPEGQDIRDYFSLHGSFGELAARIERDGDAVRAASDGVRLDIRLESDANGVNRLSGTVTNDGADAITLYRAMWKFPHDGGEYAVHTQYHGWMNESMGAWQPLVTDIAAHVDGVRSSYSAAPMLALWNEQANRGEVYHLLTKSAWELSASRRAAGGISSTVIVEGGVREFAVTLEPGQSMALPEIICYAFRNRVDLDCWKLHAWCNRVMPRRELPVIWNTWLGFFEHFTFDDIAAQIPLAADMGVDYFVIDAGWFGDGDKMWAIRGDWYENKSYAFRGRMKELADRVRAAGMKFGFWLEIESAGGGSKILAEHPDYYMNYRGAWLLDFANPDACAYILETMCGLIEQYGLEFIKFDFNQDMKFDREMTAYMRYFDGYYGVIKELRRRHPEVYLENCASGGLRMSLVNLADFDSFWLSDNQGPHEGLRIFKETIKRMPPQSIEKWATIQSLENFRPNYAGEAPRRLLATDDATWTRVASASHAYMEAFLTGTPMGFSCDLTQLSAEDFAWLKDLIAKFKSERDFWLHCTARILGDTPSMAVIEFADDDFARVEILAISDKVRQSGVQVYPVLDAAAVYETEGGEVSGAKLDADGIRVPVHTSYSMTRISMRKK